MKPASHKPYINRINNLNKKKASGQGKYIIKKCTNFKQSAYSIFVRIVLCKTEFTTHPPNDRLRKSRRV